MEMVEGVNIKHCSKLLKKHAALIQINKKSFQSLSVLQKKWRKQGDFTSERKIAEVLSREGMDFALESI